MNSYKFPLKCGIKYPVILEMPMLKKLYEWPGVATLQLITNISFS